jgi:NitT/TauT family transport system substrate-binding protein
MMYNEYWSIVAAGLSPDKLIDARLGDNGYAFLEDGLYATRAAIGDPARRAVLVRFLRATLAGWRLAAKHPDEALAATLAAASHADPLHQRRMLDTILGLIGDAGHVGELDRRAWEHSVEAIARENPDPQAIRATAVNGYTDMLWRAATSD